MMKEREYTLSKQLLRSGTSIGANIEEAQFAQSKRDFISKLSIALKEANECRYWLRIISDSHCTKSRPNPSLYTSIEEIISILVKSIKTAKKAV